MDIFEKEIVELINHCQKTDINFNQVYANSLQSVASHNNAGSHKIKEITTQQIKKQLKSRKFQFAIGLFLILSIIYYQQDVISTHATAIGRILMIQLLPFYDWRPLKRERCFLKRIVFFATDIERQNKRGYKKEDCNSCDGINYISMLKYSGGVSDDINESILADDVKSYYDIDAPILITNTSGKSFKLEDIQDDLDYTQYIPCDVESNVFIRKSSSVEDILTKLTNAPFYYAHWRNCNMNAMKLFRRFFPRPKYLHVNFAPIQQSWIILSKKYESRNYKPLKVGDRLSIVSIVKGHLKLRLTPSRFCFLEKLCNDFFINMFSGDALVVSDQWEIDYLWVSDATNASGDNVNMAIVLETH